jgi:threonine dehydratase
MRYPNWQNIEVAASLISKQYVWTPTFEVKEISEVACCTVHIKDEAASPIGSFKARGTEFFCELHKDSSNALVCASAGNFGQGLAVSGSSRGMRVTVFAPETANPLKLDRMRELGAKVRLKGRDFDEANEAAKFYATEMGVPFVEDASHAEIAEGAGTLARELTIAFHGMDAVFVPVGGGALINGVGCWVKHQWPECKVIGVCAEGAPSMALSFFNKTATPTTQVSTIADGIAIRAPVPYAVQLMERFVDDVVLVSDDELIATMKLLFQLTGRPSEPSGVAGLAAAIRYSKSFGFKRVATPLCGRNADPAKWSEWVLR